MVATPEPSWHPGWLLDEVARAGRENLDEGHVARYDAKEEADAPDEVRVCQELGLTPGVDRGGPRCRNGSVRPGRGSALRASRRRDVSPVMLDRLLRNVFDAGLTPGGVVRLWDAVYSFDPLEAEERLEAWCASAGHDDEGDWSRAELEEPVRDENSTFDPRTSSAQYVCTGKPCSGKR